MSFEEIIAFWFDECDPQQWWQKDPAFDLMIAERFAEIHAKAKQCELYTWRIAPLGRLAEIIILDQFSRNMYRDKAQAFAYDSLALALAQEAVLNGADGALSDIQRSFLYMPYMHSESAEIHDIALSLYSKNGIKENTEFELKHKAIIDRFGRYPHRNSILNRNSTPQELAFLEEPHSSF